MLHHATRADIPEQKMTFFVNIQSSVHLETSLLAVYRRNAESQGATCGLAGQLGLHFPFKGGKRPSNIDQTLIVACCPLIQLVPGLLRTTHTPPEPEDNVGVFVTNIDT